MKQVRLHTGSVIDVCDDELNLTDYIHTKLNSAGREDKDDPFFVCDLGDIVKKWRRFQRVLPMVKPYFAMKCNPDLEIIKLMIKLGSNFDCASKMEIKTLLDLGVAADRIIFANPCKQTSFIKYSAANNVKLMTFDNEMELRKVKQFYPDAELVLRIRVDDSKSLCKFGVKFGAEPCNTMHLLQTAKQLHLNVVGVSFHVGSGCYDASLFYDAVKLSRKVFDEGREVGYQFSMLDVGGGFPGDDLAKVSFEETAEKLKDGFNAFFPPEMNVKFIAEPGRYFVASACTNVCNITSVRKLESGNESNFMYYINDGVYGSFNCVMFDHYNPTANALHVTDGPVFKCSVWGPTCDSLDCISKSTLLPRMNIGDWMYFQNMGAYTIAAASKFNGFKQPKVIYMCRRKFADTVTAESVNIDTKMELISKKVLHHHPQSVVKSAAVN